MLIYTYIISSPTDANDKTIYQLQSKKYYSGINAERLALGGVGYE